MIFKKIQENTVLLKLGKYDDVIIPKPQDLGEF